MKTKIVDFINEHKGYCEYCANDEKLDKFGYCIAYDCFTVSGKRAKLDELVKRASDLWVGDSTGQVSGPVSNFYSKNHRKADDVKYDAEREFGYVPSEILDRMPTKFRHEKWDKNIRW